MKLTKATIMGRLTPGGRTTHDRGDEGLEAGVGEQAVDVAGRVGVEADQVALVVDAVERGGAGAVRVVNRNEAVLRSPDEPVRGRVVAAARGVGAHDPVRVIDAE